MALSSLVLTVCPVASNKIGTSRRAMIGSSSKPCAISCMVTPVTSSPQIIAHLMGLGLLLFGRSDARI